jgi:hypothetical protein
MKAISKHINPLAIKLIILLLFTAIAISIQGQAVSYSNLNGLTWVVINSPVNEVYNFQYNEVKGCNQLILYKNGAMVGKNDYEISVDRRGETFVRFSGGNVYRIMQTYWDRGILMGIDMSAGCNNWLNLRRQTSTAAPYYYFLD